MESPHSDSGVVVSNLSKTYKLYPGSMARLKELVSPTKKRYHEPFEALTDISFEVAPGRALGVIGENGAGKSTLLKILAGTTLPTSGSFGLSGAVSSLLELGTGFHSEFTGRANIYLAAQVQGFSRAAIEEKIDSIVEFAELGDFIDQPIRTYSSGMIMRLGFSVATAIDPEVLIIDEILAVGDLYFQKKCIDRIFEFRKAGKTILFCSHSLYDVRQICDEVIWLKDGRIEMRGLPQDVTLQYANYERSLDHDPHQHVAGHEQAVGDNLPAIDEVGLYLGTEGVDEVSPLPDTVETGVDIVFQVNFHVDQPDQGVNVGVAIFRTDNVLAATFNSHLEGVPTLWGTGTHCARLYLPDFRLSEGEYTVVGYLFDEHGIHMYDHRQATENLMVVQQENHPGLVRLHHRFEIGPVEEGPKS
ncbi:MAG: ABC transporter ATP-binding protein [Planctomycetota bacterium]|nr:ABC transporter ATP-binding protein [Planctomycetota bacterium]